MLLAPNHPPGGQQKGGLGFDSAAIRQVCQIFLTQFWRICVSKETTTTDPVKNMRKRGRERSGGPSTPLTHGTCPRAVSIDEDGTQKRTAALITIPEHSPQPLLNFLKFDQLFIQAPEHRQKVGTETFPCTLSGIDHLQ